MPQSAVSRATAPLWTDTTKRQGSPHPVSKATPETPQSGMLIKGYLIALIVVGVMVNLLIFGVRPTSVALPTPVAKQLGVEQRLLGAERAAGEGILVKPLAGGVR